MVALAEVLTVVVGVYVVAGILFAVPFVLRGVNRIDPVAREGTWGFRVIIVPGVVALWPLLARRWLRGVQPPEERNAHRTAAKRGLPVIRAARSRHRVMVVALALVVPVLFVAGLILRQPIPVTEVTSPRGAASDGESYEVLGEQTVGEVLPIRVSWLRESGSRARRAVGLTLEGPLKQPDLLLYWDDGSGDGTALPESAWLLGRVGVRQEVVWQVPEPGAGGGLVFYSTAWKKVVGSLSPPAGWSDAP